MTETTTDTAAVSTADTGTSTGSAGTSTAPLDWIGGLDPALRQEVEAAGWKTPADVLADHVKLRTTLGADKLPLPPKGADGSRDFGKWDGWAELGRPEKADAYTFPAPEGYQFTDVDTAFHAAMRPALHEAGLSQRQVDLIGNAYTAHAQALLQQAEQDAVQGRAELQREWGAAFDQRLDLARRATRAVFGDQLGPEEIRLADGRKLLDDPTLARAMAKIGTLMQEDGALPAGTGGGGTILTPDAADAEIKRIRGEAASNPKHPYNDRDNPEHTAIVAEMNRLYQVKNAGNR